MNRLIPAAMMWLAATVAAGPAIAVDPDDILDDPALESRARAISQDLRCVVCKSQSIDDSNAPLAKDLRRLVRERLVAGDTDAEIKAYVAERYGDYVLRKPPFTIGSAALWIAPMLLLVIGAGAAILVLRRREPKTPPPLTDEERDALEKLKG